jgi:hypothetical protein
MQQQTWVVVKETRKLKHLPSDSYKKCFLFLSLKHIGILLLRQKCNIGNMYISEVYALAILKYVFKTEY